MRESGRTPSRPWRRHDLLHVAADIWASVLACYPPLADLPLLRNWAQRGWPLIVRRRRAGEERHVLPVGVPLPGRQRVALLIPASVAALQRSFPPSLNATAEVADRSWRSTIDALLAVGVRSGVEPTAVGSLLWQHLTGLAYLSPHSDLDVLWPIPQGLDVLSLVFSIAEVQRKAPLRIDGEVIFPDGSAVNWRELWNVRRAPGPGMVLAKTMEGVRLLHMASLPGIGQPA